MSLINRIELSNFLVGTSKTANYRHALFDFEGKSTAVVMGNGGGKTTINNALIGMMSRNTSMIGKTRALMAIPGPGSVYSHIRIEFSHARCGEQPAKCPSRHDIHDHRRDLGFWHLRLCRG